MHIVPAATGSFQKRAAMIQQEQGLPRNGNWKLLKRNSRDFIHSVSSMSGQFFWAAALSRLFSVLRVAPWRHIFSVGAVFRQPFSMTNLFWHLELTCYTADSLRIPSIMYVDQRSINHSRNIAESCNKETPNAKQNENKLFLSKSGSNLRPSTAPSLLQRKH